MSQDTMRMRLVAGMDVASSNSGRKATPEEIERMRQVTRHAVLDGAFGLSTGLFYVPGNFTPTEEVVELAKVVGAMGGLHTSHMRDEAAKVLDSVKDHSHRRGRRCN